MDGGRAPGPRPRWLSWGDHDREIVRLAVPAFFALAAEPMLLLADSAIIGHLGTEQLAGLGIAGVVLQTIVGLCVFLAYGTTASVARRVGAGDLRAALTQGIDGLWLAVIIGVIATLVGVALTTPLVAAFGAGAEVSGQAEIYLRWAFLGVTPLLIMLAATGVLRGLQDTKTPLVVAVAANLVNIVLNVVLVYGAGLGIAGAAIGSVLAQVGAAVALCWVVVRGARHHGASLRPDLRGIKVAAHAAVALVIRTLTLRAALIVTTYAVVLAADRSGAGTGGEATSVATHQLAFTLWSFLAFVLDAIAIAAQAITGKSLGAGNAAHTRLLTRRMIQWGVISGVALGVLVAVAAPFIGLLFTEDASVAEALTPVLMVVAVTCPISGVVFVLDGVLIGAGDGAYLAWAGLIVLVVYAPAVLVAAWAGASLLVLWIVFCVVFMGARAVVLLRRERDDAWLVTGVPAG